MIFSALLSRILNLLYFLLSASFFFLLFYLISLSTAPALLPYGVLFLSFEISLLLLLFFLVALLFPYYLRMRISFF
jgi:hypothetical protein